MSTNTSTPPTSTPSSTSSSTTSSQGPSFLKIMAWVIGSLALVAVLLVVVGLVAVSSFAPGAIQNYLTQKTGFSVHSTQFTLNPLGGSLALRGFEIDNPPSYSSPLFIKITSLDFAADLGSFLTQNYHIKNVDLHIDSVALVRGANGFNAQEFNNKLNPPTTTESQKSPAAAQKPQPNVTIDHLKLQVDNIVYNSTSAPLNFTFERNNVTDMHQLQSDLQSSLQNQLLSSNLMFKLGPAAAGDITQALMGGALGSVTKGLDTGLKTGSQAAGKAAQQIGNATGNAVSGIKGLFK